MQQKEIESESKKPRKGIKTALTRSSTARNIVRIQEAPQGD